MTFDGKTAGNSSLRVLDRSEIRTETAVSGRDGTENETSQGMLSRILSWFQNQKKKLNGAESEQEIESPAWETVFRKPMALEDTGYRADSVRAASADMTEENSKEAYAQRQKPADSGSYEESAGLRDDVRVLRSMDVGEPDIPIPYYPFVIGTQEHLVDHMLDHPTVSRLHLKLENEDDRYYVQDLNSTNGTTLNGRELQNNERAEIHRGDDLRIAQYWFTFQ